MDRTPPDIDLIEILYATGEMTMPMVHVQLGDPVLSWKVLPGMVRGRTAAIWAVATDGGRRRLEPWECDALFRTRLHGTHESPFSDDELLLCSAEETSEAYHRDFGSYYEEQLRRHAP